MSGSSPASAAPSFVPGSPSPVSRRRSQPWLLMLLTAGLVAAPASVALQGVDALDLPLVRLDAQGELGNRPRDLLWPDRDRSRLRAVRRLLRLRGGVLAPRPGLGVRSASSAWGSRFRSAATPARHSRSSLSRPALFLHAVCVAFWIGALLPLALGVRDAGLRAAPSGGGELRRFSNAIVPVVVLLAAHRPMARLRSARSHRCPVDDGLWPGARGQARRGHRAVRARRRQPLLAGAEVRKRTVARPRGRSRSRSRSSLSSRW